MSNSKAPPPPSDDGRVPEEKFWSDLHDTRSRRRAPRVHSNVPVRLSLTKGASVETNSNDLSYHGLQLRCDEATAQTLRPHSSGDDAHPVYPITLQLEVGGLSLRVNAHARIAHATPIPDAPAEAAVAIGINFVSFEDGAEDSLHSFIDQHFQPAELL